MNNIKYLKINLPEDISILKSSGNFDDALNLINMRIKQDIPEVLKNKLECEKSIIAELKKEYIYTFDDALSLAQSKINNFTKEELDKFKDNGYADWILVNGKVKFHRRFLENIMKTYPAINKRLINKNDIDDDSQEDKLLDDTINKIQTNGKCAYYFHIKASVKVKDTAFEPEKTIKVHIPIPALCEQVKNINIIKTSPIAKFISKEDYPQRTAYFEKKSAKDDKFSVEYSYENHVDYKKLDYNNVSSSQPDFYTDELEPQIMFTPYIKELSKEIVGNEKNPLAKARKIYDFVTTKVMYSYMREYLTIENIPEYAALNLKGDCGVQSLLFITLCRCAKIPARWQSGLFVTPYFIGSHDWSQFYVAPYGWLFADCSFGGSAFRKKSKKRWDFYFGNIDPFRMIANSEFQYDFMPEKKFLRADPYDNQRGECEYEDKGLCYDEFESEREIIDVHQI